MSSEKGSVLKKERTTRLPVLFFLRRYMSGQRRLCSAETRRPLFSALFPWVPTPTEIKTRVSTEEPKGPSYVSWDPWSGPKLSSLPQGFADGREGPTSEKRSSPPPRVVGTYKDTRLSTGGFKDTTSRFGVMGSNPDVNLCPENSPLPILLRQSRPGLGHTDH